jgi:hypothetical protein
MIEQLVQEKIEVTCIEMHCRGGIIGSQKPVWIDGDYNILKQIQQYLSEQVLDSYENDGLIGYKCWMDKTTDIHSLGVQEIYFDQQKITKLQKFMKRLGLVKRMELDGENTYTQLKVKIVTLMSGNRHYPYAFPNLITTILKKSLFHNRILSSTDRTILLEKLIPVFPEIQFNLVEVDSFGDIAF